MKKGTDIVAKFKGLTIIHQRIPGKELGEHSHKEYEFFMPISGEISVTYENNTYSLSAGKMLFVPAHITHTFSSESVGAGERLIWLFEGDFWEKRVLEKFPILVFTQNSLAKELLFYLLLKREVKGESFFVNALLETLVESMEGANKGHQSMEFAHLEGKIEDSRIKKSMGMLRENLEGDSLSVVAKSSGMSLRNFNRLFVKAVGLTPKEYQQLCRIKKACELLETTRLTITDIALEVGFNSISKFIEAFKKIIGKLPSDYRLEHYK